MDVVVVVVVIVIVAGKLWQISNEKLLIDDENDDDDEEKERRNKTKIYSKLKSISERYKRANDTKNTAKPHEPTTISVWNTPMWWME